MAAGDMEGNQFFTNADYGPSLSEFLEGLQQEGRL